MNIEERMDPELLEAYKQMPATISVLENIAATRTGSLEWLKTLYASQPLRDLVTVRNLSIPGPQRAPPVPIRVYTPSVPVENMPALLWIHGGGFTVGHPDQDDGLVKRVVEKVQCVVVSVDYRLAPEHPFPAGPEDCYSALCWLAASARDLGVDAGRIAVGGQSAGGGLAAGVAIMARDRGHVKLAYQLLLAPCLDDRHITQSSYEITDVRGWSRNLSLEGWRAYLGGTGQTDVSPYAAPARVRDCAGLPPAYLMIGELDLMRDETWDYAGRLMRSGVATELHIWPRAFHGFEVLVPSATISKQAVEDYDAALKRALSPRLAAPS